MIERITTSSSECFTCLLNRENLVLGADRMADDAGKLQHLSSSFSVTKPDTTESIALLSFQTVQTVCSGVDSV